MPKTAALSIAFPQKPETEASVESPRSPPVDSGIEDYYKLSQPTQSPASSPRASRSFFSSFTGGKQNKGKGIEQPTLKIPSTPSSGQSTPTASHPTYHMSSDSQVNLPDTSSISEGSVQDVTAQSDTGSTDTDTTPKASEINLLGERRPSKHVFHNILNRSRSVRTDASPRPPTKAATRGRFLEPIQQVDDVETSPRTAPLDQDRSYREGMSANQRNKSADRSGSSTAGQSRGTSSNENTNMISNLRNSSTSAASGIGRASKGFFSKLTRSGSNNDSTLIVVDENYVFKIINLPLVEQTRRTRICKKLADARDKTEYWMPALPYRCIDFLNLKGVEEEGLYRVPGGVRDIKHWQARFDQEGDINLLDETELYDINIIGSILKAWLRDLPEELFPKSIQAKIAAENPAAKETPQMLKDELSKLPPYNYYLLFAVTCHIALLHSHSDKNKMNYHNLCICFQPSLGIEGYCFWFLVCEWRTCWQGCFAEKEYVVEEQRLLGVSPASKSGKQPSNASTSTLRADMGALSLNGTSRPATGGSSSSGTGTDRRRPSPISAQEEDEWDRATISKASSSKPSSSQPAGVSSPSTPPSLSPVTQVSPMRL